MGYIFGLHPSNACRMRIKMEPLVEKVADPSLSQAIKQRVSPRSKEGLHVGRPSDSVP